MVIFNIFLLFFRSLVISGKKDVEVVQSLLVIWVTLSKELL